MAFLSYEQVVVDGTVKDIDDLTIPATANGAMLQAEQAGDVNYTMDGSTSPSATLGMALVVGNDPEQFLVEDIRNIKFTQSSVATLLNIHYFGGRSDL